MSEQDFAEPEPDGTDPLKVEAAADAVARRLLDEAAQATAAVRSWLERLRQLPADQD